MKNNKRKNDDVWESYSNKLNENNDNGWNKIENKKNTDKGNVWKEKNSNNKNDDRWGDTNNNNKDSGWGDSINNNQNNEKRDNNFRGRDSGRGRGRGRDRGRGDRDTYFNKEKNYLNFQQNNDDMEIPEDVFEELFVAGINYESNEDDLKDTFGK